MLYLCSQFLSKKRIITYTMRYIYIIMLLYAINTALRAQQPKESLFLQKIAEDQLIDSTNTQKIDYAFYNAQKYKNRGNFDATIKEYLRCLEIDSTNAAAWFELSKMYQFTNNNDAYKTLLKAIKYAPDNDYYREIEAAYCISKNEYNKAIKIFEKLSKKHKSKTSYLYNLLSLYEVTGKGKKYLNTINKIEVLRDASIETVMAKVGYYNRKKQHKKAIAEINSLIDKYPHNTEYKTLIGQYYFTISDTTAALSSLNDIIKQYPNNGYVYMVLLDYYNTKNDEQQVEYCLNKIIEDQNIDISEKIEIFINHIRHLEAKNKETEADEFFNRLIEYYPKESVIYALYGAYLFERKDKDKAEDQLNTAISLNPEEENNWNILAQIQILNDSVAKLIKVADEAEKLFPNNSTWSYYKVMGHIQLKREKEAIELIDFYEKNIDDKENIFKSLIMSVKGDLLMQDSIYTEAFESYEKSLSYNPNNILTLNNYAYFLSECNTELVKAENMSSKTITAEPQNSTYLDTYAWILFKRGDLAGAKFYIERALMYSDDADLLEHYGDILFKLGETQKAVEEWKKSKSKGNSSPNLQKKIDEKIYIEKELKCK